MPIARDCCEPWQVLCRLVLEERVYVFTLQFDQCVFERLQRAVTRAQQRVEHPIVFPIALRRSTFANRWAGVKGGRVRPRGLQFRNPIRTLRDCN